MVGQLLLVHGVLPLRCTRRATEGRFPWRRGSWRGGRARFVAALCSKRHMARMHRKPYRHPRESGDPCILGPRLRGDDDPLWRLPHNAASSFLAA